MATSLGPLDIGLSINTPMAFCSITMDGDEYVRCSHCGYGGCDVRVSACGCTLHARCLSLDSGGPLKSCTQCGKATQGLILFPMSFREIDEAHKAALAGTNAEKGRSRKRKTPPDFEEKGSYVSERRTGRWTTEEMTLCDQLILKFGSGELPVQEGVKLNEFLGAMLKSKQSRLTKKMKNAKLSSKSFQRTSGCLKDQTEAKHFSALEESFFSAITDQQERAEIKFHMQKEWREQFSRVCTAIGQPLDADNWLSSVEEMDRRASQAKDAARLAKRKMMMGVALRTDARNTDAGVFIEKSEAETKAAFGNSENEEKEMEEILNYLNEDKASLCAVESNAKNSLLHSAPFLAKVVAYVQRHNVPFEHIDLWVPSFVPNSSGDQEPVCRLCYAGSTTVDAVVPEDGSKARAITPEENFNFLTFGDYSQKFSFDVGCGLPGRVYESGRATWEQSVHSASSNHFERCGGAMQWGIKTVVGIPIASPNVGRIVVTLYSCFDRQKDEELVGRLSEEFTRLMPSPKWKLVVDIGDEDNTNTQLPTGTSGAKNTTDTSNNNSTAEAGGREVSSSEVTRQGSSVGASTTDSYGDSAHPGAVSRKDPRIDVVLSILAEFMPSDTKSSWGPYISGFMSLRLLLLRQCKSPQEDEIVNTMLDSFSSYSANGRQRQDIAFMLARDFIFMTQNQQLPFLSLDNNAIMPNQSSTSVNPGLFGMSSNNHSYQDSPALAPIPPPGSNDTMSVISN